MKKFTAFIAPHRTGFLLGSLLLLASLGWWALEMLARAHGDILVTALPPMLLHGYLMLYGFFPLFMLGFIYTAGPRWLNVAPPGLSSYVPVMLAYASGTLLVLAGGWFAALLPVGVLLHVLGWTGAVLLWLGRIRASQAPKRMHAQSIAAAFTFGLCGQLAALYWSAA
ncbi:MAG: NnrS family protein, partial [Propionivibrio sp.]